MSDAMIKLHIETLTDSSYVPSFTVKISVAESSGITPCIFVHQYVPKLPCSDASYSFINVAYYDELNSVPDYLQDRKTAGLVRLSSIDKGLPSVSEVNDFISTVESSVQRLLAQVNTTAVSGRCLDVDISASTISRTISDQCDRPVEYGTGADNLAPGVVTINFAGNKIAEI